MISGIPKATPPEKTKQGHKSKEVIISIPHCELAASSDDHDPPLIKNNDEARKRRETFLKDGVRLYQAALDGDWEEADRILNKDRYWITAQITKQKDTALHIAAAAKHLEFVKNLAELMSRNKDKLETMNKHGNTAFCNAASSGNVKIAKVMVGINPNLPNIKGSGTFTPLHMAILLGKRHMVEYLKKVTDVDNLDDDDLIEILTSAIEAGLYDVALSFIKERPKLALHPNRKKGIVLHTLAAQRPLQKITRTQSIWGNLLRRKNADKEERDQELADVLELTRIAWNAVIKEDEDKISDLIKKPRRLLFVAAKRGNVDFLRTLILLYPDVIWKVDKKSRSIFHFAVKYRHEEIFNLIHEFGTIKDFIATYKDDQGQNMLHLAAKLAPPNRLNCVSGAALQMQRELLWFEAVKKVVQPQYQFAKNHVEKITQNDEERDDSENNDDRNVSFKSAQSDEDTSESVKSSEHDEEDNSESETDADSSESDDEDTKNFRKTPEELFTKEHKKLRLKGEEWMKKTAESCTLVATLITTVNFTAAFTLPGGNDEKDGSPILLNQLLFKVFAISNAVSLFASCTSILMFLSILTSRYAERDFLEILPHKLMVGLTSLFVSIATMMFAFTATFFITFQRNSIWIPTPIALLATVPAFLFLFQQSPLLWDIHCSKSQSRIFFQPSDKRTLYWSSKRPKKNE